MYFYAFNPITMGLKMREVITILNSGNLAYILTFLSAFAGVILTIEKLIKWILNKLNWYHKRKNNEEELVEIIKNHTNQICEINDQLKQFGVILENNNEITKRMLRHTVTKSCEEYLKRGSIETYELQALEDLFHVYEKILNGNSFVHTLMKKIRKLQVINEYDSDNDE